MHHLFYHPDIDENTATFSFDAEESNHLVKAMRKQAGDIVHVTNGRGWGFEAEITENDPKKCTLEVKQTRRYAKRNYYLHMAVAPTKMNDRYEWFLEKAMEIGVDEITPVFCTHSERKQVKPKRFQKILIASLKQSLQYYLPKLNEAVALEDFLDRPYQGLLFIAHCRESERYTLKRKALADHKVTILIGPEGDFSEEEVHTATKKGFTPISLGNNRLRTETAAIAACHTISLINE